MRALNRNYLTRFYFFLETAFTAASALMKP
jgi:hypothetical protein